MLDFITVNEHSSIRLEGSKVIYVDPFRIPEYKNDGDIILITHPHYDHFSPEDIEKVAKESTRYVMPKSMKEDAVHAGFSEHQIYLMQPGNILELSGVTIAAVPSYNVGKPMHPKENDWLGYVVTVKEKRIYIAGDCDLMPEESTVSCDVAMLPIGGTYTMNFKEAAECVNRICPSYVIPTHYGTLVGKPEDFDGFKPLVNQEITIVSKLPEA
ncbi:MAG: MBL fold metallo-hydrolase [Clostridia bacterium]|nr:MBL fold metallo-hydrolase [Clostridia bacterium]